MGVGGGEEEGGGEGGNSRSEEGDLEKVDLGI